MKIIEKLKFIKRKNEGGKIDVSKIKKMCLKTIQAGICPNNCDICAWNMINKED